MNIIIIKIVVLHTVDYFHFTIVYIFASNFMDMDTDYKVRVLFSGSRGEMNVAGLNYVQAKRKFLFYVSACLEFDNELQVRCINIFRGKTCIRYYQNYSINERYNR